MLTEFENNSISKIFHLFSQTQTIALDYDLNSQTLVKTKSRFKKLFHILILIWRILFTLLLCFRLTIPQFREIQCAEINLNQLLLQLILMSCFIVFIIESILIYAYAEEICSLYNSTNFFNRIQGLRTIGKILQPSRREYFRQYLPTLLSIGIALLSPIMVVITITMPDSCMFHSSLFPNSFHSKWPFIFLYLLIELSNYASGTILYVFITLLTYHFLVIYNYWTENVCKKWTYYLKSSSFPNEYHLAFRSILTFEYIHQTYIQLDLLIKSYNNMFSKYLYPYLSFLHLFLFSIATYGSVRLFSKTHILNYLIFPALAWAVILNYFLVTYITALPYEISKHFKTELLKLRISRLGVNSNNNSIAERLFTRNLVALQSEKIYTGSYYYATKKCMALGIGLFINISAYLLLTY